MKRVVCVIMCVFILSIFLLLRFINYYNSKDDIISDPKFYTKQEIAKKFNENQVLFNSVAFLLLENDFFFSEGKTSVAGARIKFFSDSPKVYFSDPEWDLIVEFFSEVKPMDIMRYNGSVIGIHFPQRNSACIDLFFFPNNLDDLHHRTKFYDEVESLGDGWFIAVIYEKSKD